MSAAEKRARSNERPMPYQRPQDKSGSSAKKEEVPQKVTKPISPHTMATRRTPLPTAPPVSVAGPSVLRSTQHPSPTTKRAVPQRPKVVTFDGDVEMEEDEDELDSSDSEHEENFEPADSPEPFPSPKKERKPEHKSAKGKERAKPTPVRVFNPPQSPSGGERKPEVKSEKGKERAHSPTPVRSNAPSRSPGQLPPRTRGYQNLGAMREVDLDKLCQRLISGGLGSTMTSITFLELIALSPHFAWYLKKATAPVPAIASTKEKTVQTAAVEIAEYVRSYPGFSETLSSSSDTEIDSER